VSAAYDRIVDALRANGKQVIERGGDKAQAQCPAHDDHNPSLSIFPRADGKGSTVKCHAGCTYADVLAAVSLRPRDLYDDEGMRNVYALNVDYKYAKGRTNSRRTNPETGQKRFTQTGSQDNSLYLVDKLDPDCPLVFFTESEKAAEAVWAVGSVAVATGGAARLRCDVEPLHGRDITVIVDRDSAGLKWARRYRPRLERVAASVRFVRCAVDISKADVVEHIDAGLDLTELEGFNLDTTTYEDPPAEPELIESSDKPVDDQALWQSLGDQVAETVPETTLDAPADPPEDPMSDHQQQAAGDNSGPTVIRDGNRAIVDVPLQSPYAIRLRRFGAHWDLDTARWWVGTVKAQALEQLMTRPLGDPVDEPPPPQQEVRAASGVLVDIASADYTLGVTDSGDPYGIHCDTPHLALMLRGGRTGLRAALARRYWDACNAPAPQQAIADACLVLEGLAVQEDPRPVHLRIAENTQGLQYGLGQAHIDMGDAEGQVITIYNGTWAIDKTAPVLFRRTKLTGEMPKPHADGNYSQLWEFVPVLEVDRPLLLAWLVQALIQADTPHPVLALVAEHGSIKSTSARCLAQIVDPSPAPLRKAPRDSDGWVTAANASWVVALDNISGEIPLWLSDCLCRSVTGEGDVRRALYTDTDVSVVAFRRAVIINGIDIAVTQPDLADRLLRVALPRIEGGERRAEKAITKEWVQKWPSILGGLLTLAAAVHHRLPSVTVTELPRMADYANVLAAVDQINGTNGLARYREQSKRVITDTLDNPFIGTLMDLRYTCEDKASKQILAELTPPDEKWKAPKGWPADARAVTGQLTRHAPALRAQGWTVDNDDAQNKACVIQWTLTPPPAPKTVCNQPLPPLPDLPGSETDWSEGLFDGRSVVDLDEGADLPGLPPSLPPEPAASPAGNGRSLAGNPDHADLPENDALTSADREAGMAGQKYTPSLVCQHCGGLIPETAPLARQRGYCDKVGCITAAANTRKDP
jgi:hypothetical protein